MFRGLCSWFRRHVGLDRIPDIPSRRRLEPRFCNDASHSILCRCHADLCPDKGICPCDQKKGDSENPPETVE